MKRRVRSSFPLTASLKRLEAVCLEKWFNIPLYAGQDAV